MSDISTAPPHVREIWDWFLMHANHDDDYKKLKRGQLLTTYDDIRNGLCWYVGYRKCRYSKSNCENALKWLKKHGMIATSKTTRGVIVTVINYSKYQDHKRYECYTGNDTNATMMLQSRPMIDNELNELNNNPPLPPHGGKPKAKPRKKKYTPPTGQDLSADNPWLDTKIWDDWVIFRQETKPLTPTAVKQQIKFLSKNQADHVEIIKTSIRASWQGLFPIKHNNRAGVRQQSAFERSRDSALEQARMLKAIREKEEQEREKQDFSGSCKRVGAIEYDPTGSDRE